MSETRMDERILTHDAAADCPLVQNGNWKRCHGHVISERVVTRPDDQQNVGDGEVPTFRVMLPGGGSTAAQSAAETDNGPGATSAGGESGLPHRQFAPSRDPLDVQWTVALLNRIANDRDCDVQLNEREAETLDPSAYQSWLTDSSAGLRSEAESLRSLASLLPSLVRDAADRDYALWKAHREGWLDGAMCIEAAGKGYEMLSAMADEAGRKYESRLRAAERKSAGRVATYDAKQQNAVRVDQQSAEAQSPGSTPSTARSTPLLSEEGSQ